jgi:hypothetical protein
VSSPRVNDQVTTPGGGSVLGEALWRMYRLVTDSGVESRHKLFFITWLL